MAVLVKYFNSEMVDELILKNPVAWCLLCLVAKRADYENGKAFIGDYRSLGKNVSEAQYRAAKKLLSDKGLCSFKGIPHRGTEATLINSEIFVLDSIIVKKRNDDGIKNGTENGINEAEFVDFSGIKSGIDNGMTTINLNNKIYISYTRSFPMIERLLKKDEERKLFVTWLVVSQKKHGDKHGLSIDEELKALIEIDESKRIESLKAAIKGAWKSIYEKTPNLKLLPEQNENETNKTPIWEVK